MRSHQSRSMEQSNGSAVFERYESNVRSYCRSFPTVFVRAKNALQWDEAGREYVDFFSGAGALNYGHNPDFIKRRLIEYLEHDGVTHALDMHAVAKRDFLTALQEIVLAPRGLDYKVQFCGPTGTNAVEAALKIARRVTGRTGVFAFTGAYHGMTLGSLGLTGSRGTRKAAGVPLNNAQFVPFPVGPKPFPQSLEFLENLLADQSSGYDPPAAIIVEAVQAEGGIFVAPTDWLRELRALCDRHGSLLIVDEIQTGCGRTGTFFGFERAGIVPDIVLLSKSISGYGMPMSIVLMHPRVDVWKPAEHTGTFRGFQLAFIGGAAALELWREGAMTTRIAERTAEVTRFLAEELAPLHPALQLRGIGMLHGVDVADCGGEALAAKVARTCFEQGLIIERCGREDTVLKIMPPLTIEPEILQRGLGILRDALVAGFRG